MDPLNSTIEIGESTVFTCKVKIDLAKTILVSLKTLIIRKTIK